jgi:hypothetical protein
VRFSRKGGKKSPFQRFSGANPVLLLIRASIRGPITLLDAIGQYAQGEGRYGSKSFLLRSTVAECTRNSRNLRNPAPIFLLLEFHTCTALIV